MSSASALPEINADISASAPLTLPRVSASTTRVPSIPVCTQPSERRAHYIQSRLERNRREKGVVLNKLEQIEKELGESRDRESRLHQTLMGEEQTLLAEKKIIDEIEEKIKQAQAEFKSKERELFNVKMSVHQLRTEITKVQASIRGRKTEVRKLEKEQERDFGNETTEIARQAEILDMNRSEIEAIAIHALNNCAFDQKIARAAEGTATPIMIREIQSEMFQRMTDITPDEFKDLMQRIRSTKEAMVSEETADEIDDSEDASQKPGSDGDKTENSKEPCRDALVLEESDGEDKVIGPGRRTGQSSNEGLRSSKGTKPNITYTESWSEKRSARMRKRGTCRLRRRSPSSRPKPGAGFYSISKRQAELMRERESLIA